METKNSNSEYRRFVAEHRDWAGREENLAARSRIARLKALEKALATHRSRLIAALKADLGKPELETDASELALVVREIRYARKRLRRWMKTRRIGMRGRVIPEPFGAALIIGPWNYPVQLVLAPVVSALAAGNGVTVKPSELTPATAAAVKTMLDETFEPAAVRTVLGDAETARSLVDAGYDKILFTGSPRVGALVAEAAAKHHTDVTLELGGKSPAIVAADADPIHAARRIAWGKFINAGQTCIAPDYVVAHEDVADRLIAALADSVETFFGAGPAASPDYARIVNTTHFDRLMRLLDGAAPIHGGGSDRESRYIAPTILRAGPGDRVMEGEIFGPILPILTWQSFEDLRRIIDVNRNPLSLYLFTRDRGLRNRTLQELRFGGGTMNDVVLHVSDPALPFGGRGSSGTGRYHGRWGFQTFSHLKGVKIMRAGRPGSVRFPPYKTLPEGMRKLIFGV